MKSAKADGAKGLTEEQGEDTMTASRAKKPDGRADECLALDWSALGANLMQRVLTRKNLQQAWEQVKANHGAAGVDGVTIEEFPGFVRSQQWARVKVELEAGTYEPQPVRRVYIPKDGDGKRPLGIPVVLDRVIEQALAQVLEPLFDPEFSDHSYGFRKLRGAHDAVRQAREYRRQGYTIAVDMDLAKFFDSVNFDILMQRVARKVHDPLVLKLIWRYLRAGVMENGQWSPSEKGVPQGGPLSPLLANIVLHDLDMELERRGHKFVRYADDFLVLVRSAPAGYRVMASLKRFLERELRLTVNLEKSKVAPLEQCRFLGFTFRRTRIVWSEKSIERFRRRIKELTGRSWGVSMEYRLEKLSEYIRGWTAYFALSEWYSPVPDLDEWIRRRVRMCYWKQWKRCRKRVSELLKLGVNKRQAIFTALSRKSYWHLSRTMATQCGMTDAWLKSQGLVSMRELWIAFHYPAANQSGCRAPSR
jgi:RNA-directed DNA polymerase